MLSSRAQWRPNLTALAAVCRPVVVELWGHGRSPAPAQELHYRPEGYVAAFERVRTAMAVDRWFVVGQSLGAALTLRYSLEHPERVIAQVFTNSVSALVDTSRRPGAHGRPSVAARILEQGRTAIEDMPVHPRNARHLDEEVRRELVADANRISPAAVARTLLHTVPAASVRTRVGATAVPTLLVAGRREAAFSEPRAMAVASIRGLEVVDLDAGHAVNLQQSAAFDGAVTSFFQRHRPAGA
jgi:pimeloyl-ACP methyl ester carboxylesterase